MRHLSSVLLLIAGTGCAVRSASALSDPPLSIASAPALDAGSPSSAAEPPASTPPAVAIPAVPGSAVVQGPAPDEAATADDESDADDEGSDADSGDEGESHDVAPADGEVVNRYTGDVDDAELAQRWKTDPSSLGSISFGFTDEGRLLNGVAFPEGPDWIVVSPGLTCGTKETIDFIEAAIRRVKEQFPDAPPLRVNQISAREGGYLRPHKSHQNGRDADLAFYYPTAEPIWAREREKYIDVPKTWALLKALVTLTDVQLVLVDRRVQQVLYDYALGAGEDEAWLDSLFRSDHPLVQHARHHRDHFHVRFFNARAQEFGRRVSPLLALRPDQNIRMHRVRRGDTLGHIALRYGSSVAAIQKANHIRGHMLRVSQVLMVPLRGPCTKCPIPAAVIVPPRRLPPAPPPVAAMTPVPAAVTPATSAAPVESATAAAAPAISPAPIASPPAAIAAEAPAAVPAAATSTGGSQPAPDLAVQPARLTLPAGADAAAADPGGAAK